MSWGVPRYVIFGLIFGVLTASIGYFVIKSYATFDTIVTDIGREQASEAALLIHALSKDGSPDQIDILARAALEIDTTRARHKRSTSALITRTWLRFTSACFGAILIAIGAMFVLGQVTAGITNIGGGWDKAKVSLAVSSPGLLLAILGTVLIVVPNVARQEIASDDTASFFAKHLSAGTAAEQIEASASLALQKFCAENPTAKSCEK